MQLEASGARIKISKTRIRGTALVCAELIENGRNFSYQFHSSNNYLNNLLRHKWHFWRIKGHLEKFHRRTYLFQKDAARWKVAIEISSSHFVFKFWRKQRPSEGSRFTWIELASRIMLITNHRQISFFLYSQANQFNDIIFLNMILI